MNVWKIIFSHFFHFDFFLFSSLCKLFYYNLQIYFLISSLKIFLFSLLFLFAVDLKHCCYIRVTVAVVVIVVVTRILSVYAYLLKVHSHIKKSCMSFISVSVFNDFCFINAAAVAFVLSVSVTAVCFAHSCFYLGYVYTYIYFTDLYINIYKCMLYTINIVTDLFQFIFLERWRNTIFFILF